VRATGCGEILILAGDHLYRMDYAEMIDFHRARNAEVTVAVKPISKADAYRFGVLKMAESGRLTDFIEKPQSEEDQAAFISRECSELPLLGSMGIYLFQAEKLYQILDSEYVDFGQHVLPASIDHYQVFGYVFDGYWEDIGTIRSFYEANLALARPDNPFRFHDPVSPIYTHPRFLPGSRIYDVKLDDVLLADGCVVEGAEIRNAVIGIRSIISDDVVIHNTVMMGADYYEAEARRKPVDAPPIGIGHGSRISGAIIDKNARIGEEVQIKPFPGGVDQDQETWSVRDGIVVVPKSAVIPDGTVIPP
jgi:glucose-1-phosphate adenylyltransferase